MREYTGQTVTMSFKAKLVGNIGNGIYIQNNKENKNRIKMEGLSAIDWKEFSYTITIDETGYLGFYVNGGNGIEIQELQIELGSKKTQYEEYQYALQMNVEINLWDRRNEISTKDYYVKIYEDNNLMEENQYQEIGENNTVENAVKSYMAKEEKDYKVELVIKINGREYILDSQEFSSTLKEIKGISTVEEYYNIQPKGKYIILNDLELKGTFGSTNLSFDGQIDFNGKNIQYLLNEAAMFWKLGKDGLIENLVLDVHLPKGGGGSYEIGAIFVQNYGTIRCLNLNLVECYDEIYKYTYLLGYQNTGVIEKFIINLQVPFYVYNKNGIIQESSGIIQNGYLYGNNMINTREIDTSTVMYSFLDINKSSGILKNVYSLISINSIDQKGVNHLKANFVRSNQGTIQNIYSVGIGNETNIKRGPNIYENSGGRITNSFYFYDRIFDSSYDSKVSNFALYDTSFQEKTLNENQAFLIDELVLNEYYPHLDLPACMPNQEYISLPKIAEADLPDITSSEILEKSNKSAKVKFEVNNIYGETIKEIKVQNADCNIISQEYSAGKSKVIAEITNPIQYVSRYNVLELTTKGVYNISYTRKYVPKERTIMVDFYREINSIQDWTEINKFPNENYILNTDLNFINESSNILINTDYRGKINGNNHTISNITIPNTSSGLIESLSGQIENLNIQNYKHQIGKDGNKGIIVKMNTGAILDHICVKDVAIQNSKVENIVVGGLVGSASNSLIQNSSITNLVVQSEKYIGSVHLGGILGYGSSTMIRNCFVQDIKMEVKQALVSKGLGGIIGKNVSGSIQNCYSIGEIISNREYVGGIAGYSENEISDCYSMVNIRTTALYAGGIVGFSKWYPGDRDNENPIAYNLYLGNIYCDTEVINRISGNNKMGKGNCGWLNQKINGMIKEKENSVTILKTNQIFDKDTYQNILIWDDNYEYDSLKDNVFPKLYDVNKTGLLKDQRDNVIQEAEIKIEEVLVEKSDVNTAQIQIGISNSKGYPIQNIIIEGMNIEIKQNVYQNGMTYLNIQGRAEKYLDSYRISQIEYEKDKKVVQQAVEAMINVQFFKEINSFEDWQEVDKIEAQNYRLMADIDFEGKDNINYNVSIGRLEGKNHVLKNAAISMNESGGFIKEAKYSINNLTFENFTIENSASGDYTGIICNNFATIENLNFKDIHLNAQKRNYVGCIANNGGNVIRQIQLKNITIAGTHYVGGLIGNTIENKYTDIRADNIQIEALGNYVGGVIGFASYEDYRILPEVKDIIIQNSIIKGKSYTGGAFGYCRLNQVQSINNQVEGESYVGGITGYGYANMGTNNIAKDVIVKGSGSNIGGICGWHDGILKSYVIDSLVEGTSTSSNYIGGIAGSSNWTSDYCYVINSEIRSKGNYVGGINGGNCGADYCYTKDCIIEGNAYVGGINANLSMHAGGSIYNCYTNSTITATSHSAGGIVGYITNKFATDLSGNQILVRYNAVEGSHLSSKAKAGGIIGVAEKELYSVNQFTGNYIETYIESEDLTSTSMGVGNEPKYNEKLKDIGIYQYSTINGENISLENEPYINTTQYLQEIDLKQESTYKTKLGWGTQYLYTSLINGKYPILNATFITEQEGIDLPKDNEHMVNAEAGISLLSLEDEIEKDNISPEHGEEVQETFEYNGKKIETYETYSVITNADGTSIRREERLYVKDGKLYVIDGSLDMVINNLIVDSYNGKEYETILGTDGKLYDLKDEIHYPENFRNEKIETIGNNLHQEEKEITVTYEDGSKVTFNYQTGEVIEEQKVENNTSLLDYLKEQLETGNNLIENTTESYEENKTLMSKLQTTPIEKAMELKNEESINNTVEEQIENTTNSSNETSSITSNNRGSYITVYNNSKKEFEVYKEEEILDVKNEEVVSQNEKIEKNNLNEYYIQEARAEKETSGIVWVLLSITGAVIVLFILWKIRLR